MTLKNTADRWGPVSQAFHWLIVLLILGMAIVGLTMGELPKTPKYFWVYTAHKSTGLTVLALVVARAGCGACMRASRNRYRARRPGRNASPHVTHWMLYGADPGHADFRLAVRLRQRAASVPLVRPVRHAQAESPPDEALRDARPRLA